MANSSATRTGFEDRKGRPQDRDPGTADKLAQRTRHDHRVRGQREARIMVLRDRHPVEAELIGATELVEGGLHRPHRRVARIILARERPDVVRCRPHVARGAEERCLHFIPPVSRSGSRLVCHNGYFSARMPNGASGSNRSRHRLGVVSKPTPPTSAPDRGRRPGYPAGNAPIRHLPAPAPEWGIRHFAAMVATGEYARVDRGVHQCRLSRY